jgi:hypothetical protein
MRHLEHEHQKALFIWWELEAGRRGINPRLMWATPNGGFRHIGTARRLKAEGVKAGVPDVFLAIPSKGYHGLFIELKAPKGRVSPEQGEMVSILLLSGYQCRVCYGWDDARGVIENYLGWFK